MPTDTFNIILSQMKVSEVEKRLRKLHLRACYDKPKREQDIADILVLHAFFKTAIQFLETEIQELTKETTPRKPFYPLEHFQKPKP